jgi:hypothetical protein
VAPAAGDFVGGVCVVSGWQAKHEPHTQPQGRACLVLSVWVLGVCV